MQSESAEPYVNSRDCIVTHTRLTQCEGEHNVTKDGTGGIFLGGDSACADVVCLGFGADERRHRASGRSSSLSMKFFRKTARMLFRGPIGWPTNSTSVRERMSSGASFFSQPGIDSTRRPLLRPNEIYATFTSSKTPR